jgi:uncharacterized membrane protein YfcA
MDVLFEPTVMNWVLIAIAAFINGLSKAGVKGIDMMNITIMAIVFGGKASTGVVLPLLCTGDVLAVLYYHRHAQWNHFWKLVPWMVVGILIGVYVGKDLDEAVFRRMMSVIIMLTIGVMVWFETRRNISIPDNKLFAAGMGLISGFATMLGNLAGAFASIYFLATRMLKNDFIGTSAWIFLLINFFKLPFQVIYWKNITASSLRIDLYLLPAMLIGFYLGIKVVAKIKDNSYRKVVFVLTLIGAVFIFIKR